MIPNTHRPMFFDARKFGEHQSERSPVSFHAGAAKTGLRCLFVAIMGLTVHCNAYAQKNEHNSSTVEWETAAVTLSVPSEVLDGYNLGIKVAGLKPKEVVRIHVLRSLEKWKEENGNWQQVRQGLHAWADFTAAADGTVNVDTQAPVRGTYSTVDPLALLRTGYRLGDPALREVLSVSGDEQTSGSTSQVWVKLAKRKGRLRGEF